MVDQKPQPPTKKHRKRRSRAPQVVSALKAARAPFQGKRLPGRPRNDGLPPIQRKKLLEEAGIDPRRFRDQSVVAIALTEEETALVARIRYLSGRGLPAKLIAALTKVPLEDLDSGGRWANEMLVGKAEATLVVAESMYNRVLEGKTIEALFWLKCNAGWSETPQGRKKAAEEEGDSEISEIELTVVK